MTLSPIETKNASLGEDSSQSLKRHEAIGRLLYAIGTCNAQKLTKWVSMTIIKSNSPFQGWNIEHLYTLCTDMPQKRWNSVLFFQQVTSGCKMLLLFLSQSKTNINLSITIKNNASHNILIIIDILLLTDFNLPWP